MSAPRQKDWRLNRKTYFLQPEVVHQQSCHPLLTSLYAISAGHIAGGFGHHIERGKVDEYVIIYCVGGQGWFRIGGRIWSIQPGEVLLAPANTPHAYGADNFDPWTIHWAHFQGTHVPGFLQLMQISVEQPVISVGVHHHLIDLFNTVLAILRIDHSLPHLINAAAYLRQLMSSLILLSTPSPTDRSESATVTKAIDFMHQNITKLLRLDELALRTNLSCSHFARVFRQQTGHAPIDYFIRLKMQKACELLETTEMKVGEISAFLGYRDQYYFSRLFKRVMQQSPRRYRRTRWQSGGPLQPRSDFLRR